MRANLCGGAEGSSEWSEEVPEAEVEFFKNKK